MNVTDPLPHEDPDRKAVINLYAAFGISLLAGCVPMLSAALVSLVFFLGVLIAAYVMRGRSEDESLGANHATYIIRTIWIGSAMAALTLALGSLYMLQVIDSAPLMACAENAVNQMGTVPNMGAMSRQMQPCIDEFIALNISALTISALIVIAPVAVYFLIRFVRGFSRAVKGYRLADPKGWV